MSKFQRIVILLVCMKSLLTSETIFAVSEKFPHAHIPPYFGVDFCRSMENANRHFRSIMQNDAIWILTKALYDKYIIENVEYSEAPRIPKIIHQIWIGGPLPEKYKILQQSWLKNHPDWHYFLWTEKEIKEFGLINQDIYDKAKNTGEKSDIARYEILYRIGGLYVDTDFECLKPFDIFHHCCDFYTGLAFSIDRYEVFCALIGARPHHPILEEIVKKLSENFNQYSNKNGNNTQDATGPYFLTRCIVNILPTCTDRTVLFPTTYFYPWPHWERSKSSRAEIERYFKPETYAVHHWHVSWSK